jgi:hypothetical protein
MTVDTAAVSGAVLFTEQAHNYSRQAIFPNADVLCVAPFVDRSTVGALTCLCRFRPRYPQQVYDIILSHLGADQRSLAVDVATGSGQAAVQLAVYFKQVNEPGWHVPCDSLTGPVVLDPPCCHCCYCAVLPGPGYRWQRAAATARSPGPKYHLPAR